MTGFDSSAFRKREKEKFHFVLGTSAKVLRKAFAEIFSV